MIANQDNYGYIYEFSRKITNKNLNKSKYVRYP